MCLYRVYTFLALLVAKLDLGFGLRFVLVEAGGSLLGGRIARFAGPGALASFWLAGAGRFRI